MTYGQDPYGNNQGGAQHQPPYQQGAPQYGSQPYPQAPPPPPPGYPGGYGAPPIPGAQSPDDLTLPLYGATFAQGVSRFFRNYVNFSGRASKSEYWWPILATYLSFGVLVFLAVVIGGATDGAAFAGVFGVLAALILVAVILPSIAVSVRRLHDANQSGWMYLLNFVPLVNYVWWIIIGVMNSNPMGMRFDQR